MDAEDQQKFKNNLAWRKTGPTNFEITTCLKTSAEEQFLPRQKGGNVF